MGDGLMGWAANITCILWTLFVSVIFSIPTIRPVTKDNMNYASVITFGVVFLAYMWYLAGARHHYHGPASNLTKRGENSNELYKNSRDSDDNDNMHEIHV